MSEREAGAATEERADDGARWDSAALARHVARFAAEKKAEHIVLMDVEAALQVTDWFVIAEGRNKRHMNAIAENVARELKRFGIHRLAGTPFTDEQWIVLDFGPVVLHVFSHDARGFYDLENLWSDCERTDYAAEPETSADDSTGDGA